jgi:hypothetical protein
MTIYFFQTKSFSSFFFNFFIGKECRIPTFCIHPMSVPTSRAARCAMSRVVHIFFCGRSLFFLKKEKIFLILYASNMLVSIGAGQKTLSHPFPWQKIQLF